MEHDHMIEAFATNASDHPLDMGSLPRRARCRQHFANAHVSHVFSEVIAKDRITIAQEVARELGKGKCLAQLLSGPICGRVGGHIEMQDATRVMGQNQKYVKDLEADKKLLKQREWRLRWAEKTGTGFTLPGHQQAAAEASNGKPGKLLQFRKVGYVV